MPGRSFSAGSGSVLPWRPVLLLAPAQLVSWGTLYYGLTFLAGPIHDATGWSLTQLFAAFSAGLLVTALLTPLAGDLITRYGARPCLAGGSAIATGALMLLGLSPSLPFFWLGWLLGGVAMAFTLYEAAFSALRESAGTQFRNGVAALAIIAGLASTLAWPLTSRLLAISDWRTVFLVFAALHALVALPVHLSLPRPGPTTGTKARQEHRAVPRKATPSLRALAWLAAAFALATMVSSAVSAQVAVLLSSLGLDKTLVLWSAMLIGPMQVIARALDMGLHGALSLERPGFMAFALPPFGVGLLLVVPAWPWVALLFAVLYGTGHGLVTIVRAVSPTHLGAAGTYARITGWLAFPSHLVRALAPAAAAVLLETGGPLLTLIVLISLGLLSLLAFLRALSWMRSLPAHRTDAA